MEAPEPAYSTPAMLVSRLFGMGEETTLGLSLFACGGLLWLVG